MDATFKTRKSARKTSVFPIVNGILFTIICLMILVPIWKVLVDSFDLTTGYGMLDQLISDAIRETMTKSVGELAAPLPLDGLRDALLREYEKLVRNRLAGVLQMVNLGGVVEDKLNAISMAELEKMIMSVMKKELRAIVWLGALLGFIMGIVQTALSLLL